MEAKQEAIQSVLDLIDQQEERLCARYIDMTERNSDPATANMLAPAFVTLSALRRQVAELHNQAAVSQPAQ